MIDINKVLADHKLWLNCRGGCRADLRGADLYGADLREANLCRANLREADLCRANLYGADLREANLYGADLRGANLYGADLREANLYGADLRGADLYGADLRGADLYGADLREANLCRANLYGADLRGADLREANLCRANLREADLCRANLYGADLRGADLREANLGSSIAFYPLQCPESGSFIGWKKCRDGQIVKLEICEDALRSSATSRKCRCSKAKVLGIETLTGKKSTLTEAISQHDITFVYRIGEIVSVDNYDTNRWNECAPGIHFFITREEAVKY